MNEYYNLINYLKIVDVSLLNLIDYVEINESKLIIVDNDKLILNLNATSKRLIEGFIINNINNEMSYGKHNILVNSCKPAHNWRNTGGKVKTSRILLNDESIYIDIQKLNSLVDGIFRRLPDATGTFSKKSDGQKSSKMSISIQKELKLLEFYDIDIYDLYIILNKTLSTFGIVNKDQISYNIISDGNYNCFHDSSELGKELYEKVRLELIKKGII